MLEVIAGYGQFFRLPDDYGVDFEAPELCTTGQNVIHFPDFLAPIKGIDPEGGKT